MLNLNRRSPVNRQAILENVLHHVVLARGLPTTLDNDDELEQTLLDEYTKSIQECADWIPPQTIKNFQKFQFLHNHRETKTVAEQLNTLKPGDTFAMLLKAQRTVFTVHMPYDANPPDQ